MATSKKKRQQALSAIGGALSTVLVFGFAARLLGVMRALPLSLAFALTWTMWTDASVGETLTPANAAVAGVLVCALDRVAPITPSRR